VRSIIRRLIADEKGANAIEYALVATLIAIAAIAGITQLGSQVSSTYNEVRECVGGTCR